MPIAPAVAVMAGLAFGPLIRRRHWTAVAALAATVGLFVYQVVLVTLVIPHNVVKYGAPAPARAHPRRGHRGVPGAGLHASARPRRTSSST